MNMLKRLKNLFPNKKKGTISILKEKVRDKNYWLAAGIAVGLVIIFYPRPDKHNDNNILIQIRGATISAEIADSPSKRSIGLMFRKKLPENQGMLFTYNNEAKHSFWMKNTLIPLDILWINAQQEIVHIEHSAPPCKRDPCPNYISPYKALYVLEVNGGWSIDHEIQLGDRVSFSR